MRLTIGIPTVDRAYCVQRAVNSALAQSCPDVEILVSNNASTDGTRALLDDLAAKNQDHRLRIVHHDRRLHAAVHGAFLIAEGRGSLFVGLSDDDWLEPDFASSVLSLFDRHPELSFAYTRCWMHLDDLILPSPAGPETESSVDFLDAYLAGRRQIYWCACVTRRADLMRLGPQPLDRHIGDMYFWTKLALEGPVGCVGKHLSHYTYLADNVSIGIPAPVWADETSVLVEEVLAGLQRLQVPTDRLARIRTEGNRYVARSTANQFALNAQRGASKLVLFHWLRECWRYLKGDLTTALPRVLASLVLPDKALRPLLYAAAARRVSQAPSHGVKSASAA